MIKRISAFLDKHSEHPLLLGFICGLYPFLFYYSNNYSSINSGEHLRFFILVFLGIPILVFTGSYFFFRLFPRFKKYEDKVRFILIIMVAACLMSQAIKLKLMKKVLTVILMITVFLAWKYAETYKKVLMLILIMAVIPLFKNIVHLYEHSGRIAWMEYPNDFSDLKLVHRPNIYILQPDGYVAQTVMQGAYYDYESVIYDWLDARDFKLYDDFRSNYPASLTSNASMFAMKQHYFGDSMFPTLESSKTRDVICGDNPVVQTLKANGYYTFFIGEAEYFMQNRAVQEYDYYHIPFDTIPYFSNDERIKNDVAIDFKKAFEKGLSIDQPKFFFVERVLPHHVHFLNVDDRISADREEYIENVQSSDIWIKETVQMIEERDSNALIVVLADHGGWAGNDGFNEMYSTQDPVKITSIYSTLAAIKWNGLEASTYDEQLHSNVNVFRVLLAALSENTTLLQHMEDDSSYNLNNTGFFRNKVVKVIDDAGSIVYEKHKKKR